MRKVARFKYDTGDFRIEGLRDLSESATQFLRRHPREARVAVFAALEAAAAQYQIEIPGTVAAAGLPEALAPFVKERRYSERVLGVSEAAELLEISRTTVYDWVEKKTLIGLKSTKRGLRIPAEQILGPGKVVPGIDKVLDIIGGPELAWAFLSQDWPFATKVARPIDKLKSGAIDEVLSAAPSFGTAVT